MLPKFARNIGVGVIVHARTPPCLSGPRGGPTRTVMPSELLGGTVMRLGHRSTHVVLASAIATLAITSLTSAQERAGVVTTLEGKVTVVRASSPELTPLKFRDAVFVRDRITTGKDSFARVLLGGKAVVTIREFSAVTITEVPGVATVDVGSGRVAVAVARERMRPGDLVEVRTPNAVAGIRGTVIVAEVFDAQRSVITVLKGVIDVTRLDAGRAAGPATTLNALQQVTITGANPVPTPQPIPSDAAQRMGAEFRSAPPRGAQSATTAAVSQGEMERAAKDVGIAPRPATTLALADGSSGKGKAAQSDQSGDSDKGKGTSSAGSSTTAAGGGAASIASNPQLLKWFDSFRDTIKDLREAQREAQREQRRNTRER